MSNKFNIARAILTDETKTDDIKLFEIFNMYKDDLKNNFSQLYYALLGWADTHKQGFRGHKEMKIKRISKGEMPPMGKYVLIYAGNRPWGDSTDPENVFWKVAKRVPAEVFGNNTVPYKFNEFGPDNHFGQEIDIWCELPSLEEVADENNI